MKISTLVLMFLSVSTSFAKMENLPKFNEPKQVEKVQIDTLKDVELLCPLEISFQAKAWDVRAFKRTWLQPDDSQRRLIYLTQGLKESYLDSSKSFIVCRYQSGLVGIDMRSKIGDNPMGYDCSQKNKGPHYPWICKPISR